MSLPSPLPIQVFNARQDYAVTHRQLPHWSQSGTVTFITWRTWDSLPKAVMMAWIAARNAWLSGHGIDPAADNWQVKLQMMPEALANEFRSYISDRWNDQLDACHGDCVLRRSELAQIVANSLLHFDGDRYELTDFVVMPNHVHLMAAFANDAAMLQQCDSWKHFTATRINQALSRKGRFWQQDGFDHLVRSTDQFNYLRGYFADNPRRARLQSGEFFHWSKPLSSSRSAR